MSLRKRIRDADPVVTLLGAVLLLLFATVPETADIPPDVEPQGLDWLAVVILGLGGAALLVRRRFPVLVVVVSLVLIGWWHAAGYTNGLINVVVLVAYFTVGATGDRRRQIAAMVLAVGPLLGLLLIAQPSTWSPLITAVAWPAAALLFGELSRSRRALIQEYRRRAEQAEAEREAEAQRRVAEERLRIARDLHDLLGHTVSLMTVQAGVAADTFDRAPDKARAAIDHIRAAGRQATNEIRATVELLRRHDEPLLSPTPGIADIPALVTSTAGLGLDVDCRIDPSAYDVDGLVGLTAYRIVQEALTNVVRHAGASHVWIALTCTDGTLTCSVTDDGFAKGGIPARGTGLTGMMERVVLVGGTVRYGPRDGGGFEVVATLPTQKGAA
jgi:signal transduction histidine kinase